MWAKALDYEVYVFSRGNKKKDSTFKFGTDYYIDSTAKRFLESLYYKLDLVLSCSSSSKNLEIYVYLSIFKVNGEFISLGFPEERFTVKAQSL